MESNEKLINNMISYFTEAKLLEEFKKNFLDKLKNDVNFEEKLKTLLEADENAPNDEFYWKKIIESNENLLSQEMKEKIFGRFKELLCRNLK